MAQFWNPLGQPQAGSAPYPAQNPQTTGPNGADAGYQAPTAKPYMPPEFQMNQLNQQPTLGNNQASPVQLPSSVLGPMTPKPQGGEFANMPPAIYQRMLQGAARYLPGSKSPLDPNFSQNLLSKSGGNWRSMIPDRAKSSFGEFERQFGQMNDFSQYSGNPAIQALMRRRMGG